MSNYYKPITPGQYLEEEFLKPFGITQSQLSRDLDISISKINNIKGISNIYVGMWHKAIASRYMALRLSEYFRTSVQMWLNLQSHYDLRIAKNEKLDQIKNRIRPFLKVNFNLN